MVPSGYAIASLDRGLVICLAGGADVLYPAVSKWGEVWVELASRSSRIVRLPLRGLPFGADQTSIEVEDAEQPAVSHDAKWLAFIREKRGAEVCGPRNSATKRTARRFCAAESMVGRQRVRRPRSSLLSRRSNHLRGRTRQVGGAFCAGSENPACLAGFGLVATNPLSRCFSRRRMVGLQSRRVGQLATLGDEIFDWRKASPDWK